MPDNTQANAGTGGDLFATRAITYSGDAAKAQVVGLVAFSGSDDAKSVADLPGDAANGLDVDVTRMAALVAGSAVIGKVGIDQTTPGTTNAVVATLASSALSAAVSVTRPSNATPYTAGDVVGVTGGGTASISFALGAVSGARILITSASLERDVAALAAGETSYLLHLYTVTQPGAQVDNDLFDLAAGDRASYLGYLSLGTPVDFGSTLYVQQDSINKQVKLSGTGLFGVLVTEGAYTPTSAAVHLVTLHAVQL